MSKLKEFLQWHLENPHNLNFKMIVSYEEREETLKEMQGIVNILDTGLAPDEINALRERDEEKAPIWKGGFYGGLHCSVCNAFLLRKTPFCPNCGQRLKWED